MSSGGDGGRKEGEHAEGGNGNRLASPATSISTVGGGGHWTTTQFGRKSSMDE